MIQKSICLIFAGLFTVMSAFDQNTNAILTAMTFAILALNYPAPSYKEGWRDGWDTAEGGGEDLYKR